jgi:GDP-4-dehydro-6-deoxy-D-mannose reductase
VKALITGVTGFVGLYLAEHLLDCGDEVIGCAVGDWTDETPDRVRRHVSLFSWDMSDSQIEGARRQVERFAPDCIYHLAALSTPGDCGGTTPTARAVAINVGGTRDVLQLAAEMKSRPRVLVTSSAYVYAPVNSDNPTVTEDSPVGPVDGYGQTKLAAERECLARADDGVDVVIARAFSQTGPRQIPRFMLPEWASQFADEQAQSIRVITLDSHLDLSDVRDTVTAYRLLAEHGRSSEIYNVGSGRCVCSGEVFRQLQELAGQSRAAVQRSPGRRQHPIADVSRLMTATGWQPRIPLKRTISDTLAYWRSRSV